MAGNTRGKIKEHLEGCHRNFDWIQFHLATTLTLLQDHKSNLSEAIKAFSEAVVVLDEQVQGVYGKI